MTTGRAAAKTMKLKQIFSEHGDKAGKLLAWQIKKRQVERDIIASENPSGNIIDQVKINEAFILKKKHYYGTCYVQSVLEQQFKPANYLYNLNKQVE